MSIEETKEAIRNEVDEYLKSKVVSNTEISRSEMVEEISGILQKYIKVSEINTEVEVLIDGKYPVVRYTISRSE